MEDRAGKPLNPQSTTIDPQSSIFDLRSSCRLPVSQPPPIIMVGVPAIPPVAVFPGQLDRSPAERDLGEWIGGSTERPGPPPILGPIGPRRGVCCVGGQRAAVGR